MFGKTRKLFLSTVFIFIIALANDLLISSCLFSDRLNCQRLSKDILGIILCPNLSKLVPVVINEIGPSTWMSIMMEKPKVVPSIHILCSTIVMCSSLQMTMFRTLLQTNQDCQNGTFHESHSSKFHTPLSTWDKID